MPGGLCCCDGWELFHSFTTCEGLCSLGGLHLRAGRNHACSLFLVVTAGVHTGAVADGRTGLFPQNKPIQAMLGQRSGSAGLRSTGMAAGQWHQLCRSPEEQRADPQPCLRHDGTRLTLSRVTCVIYCILGSC